MDENHARIDVISSCLASRDGLQLAVDSRGPATAPSVLFAHGFGQSRHAWTRAAESLAAAGWHTVTFDMRGHGDSGRVVDGAYDMQQFGDDLVAVAASLGAPPVLVGASMGGLLGLVAAGEIRPDPFRALVLVDITPRWETAGVERMLGFMRAHPQGFASLDEASDEVTAYLPQRQRRKDRYELAQLLHRGADGRLRWHWDPAMLATVAGDGERHQRRILEAARHIDVPVLLLSGGRSDIVSEATIAEFMQVVPHARHVQIAHAAHTLAGDDNAAFSAALEPFLDTLPTACEDALPSSTTARDAAHAVSARTPTHRLGDSP